MKGEKKILVAVTNDISTDQRVHKVSSYLQNKGYDVLVYGRILPDTVALNRTYNTKRIKHFFNHNFLFYAEYNLRLFIYLLFNRSFTHILSNDLDTLAACYMGAKIQKSELIYDSHEFFTEVPELQGRKFVRNFWLKVEGYFLPKIKKAYTVSPSIAQEYKERYGIKMGVVRNMPLLNKKTVLKDVDFPTDKKVILYQGVLNPGRGLEAMVKALHILPNYDLVIIGYGKVLHQLQAFITQENLSNRVHFLGTIPHEELPNYTNKADIGIVLEEPKGKSFKYSLPNKFFDYTHACLPFITTDLLIEVKKLVDTHQNGVLAKNHQPESIREAILLLENDSFRAEIIKKQLLAQKTLCWEEEVKKLDVYY